MSMRNLKCLLLKTAHSSGAKKKKGTGHDNGVGFSYTVETSDWFGTCKLKINRCLLDKKVPRVATPIFEVGGYRWFVVVRCLDSHLGVSLWSENDQEVTAHHSYTLVNEGNHSVVESGRATFSLESRFWGFPNFILLDRIKRPGSGFFQGDSLVLHVALRIVTPENEKFSVSVVGTEALCTWEILHLSEMSGYALRSEGFNIGKSEWSLTAYPKTEEGQSDDLAIYLWNRGKRNTTATCHFTAVNHRSAERSRTRKVNHNFSPDERWGWPVFLSMMESMYSALGFVKDGWLTFTVRMSIKDIGHSLEQICAPARAAECVLCRVFPQTSGVLHGDTMHKCYCVKCAERMSSVEDLRCPLCRRKVERIIKQFL